MLYNEPILPSTSLLGETETYENRFISYLPKYECKLVDHRVQSSIRKSKLIVYRPSLVKSILTTPSELAIIKCL